MKVISIIRRWKGPLKRLILLPADLAARTDRISGFMCVSLEQSRCDPKACELCLGRMKSGETLVEVRKGSDVQIDLGTQV